ncbi:uncharacterized protein BO96DRAFT_436996 [Aspergillus niger CBS 101883]|uniref:Contig An07c0220, genomic contig n=2 Tax=Aspergillus niger TaxID=5061 RepID=A5AAZ7_ASPNC|nr:uncharacterized protein BO96DRAFT_436996 [Aspergillus niger CBS 101883]XP_059601028.1 uncharacterized protein An07g07960 [Aspergillus niger]PYH53365.1 hypothetical protein BO96DRAFT_436996 [Aspergillus niger CBS 101883]CAK39612.1 unnamed protein product [Aspergillus niger]
MERHRPAEVELQAAMTSKGIFAYAGLPFRINARYNLCPDYFKDLGLALYSWFELSSDPFSRTGRHVIICAKVGSDQAPAITIAGPLLLKASRGTHVIDDAIPVQRDQEPTATGGVDILEGKVLQQWSTPQPNCVLLCTV